MTTYTYNLTDTTTYPGTVRTITRQFATQVEASDHAAYLATLGWHSVVWYAA